LDRSSIFIVLVGTNNSRDTLNEATGQMEDGRPSQDVDSQML